MNYRPTRCSLLTLLICGVISVSILSGHFPPIIATIYGVMSVLTFISYAIDKSAAQNGRWRIKERTLHSFALLGGWPGAYYAQVLLRHKTKKVTFRRSYWCTVLLNLLVLSWFYTDSGQHFINTRPLLIS